jgi:hypothetical protein
MIFAPWSSTEDKEFHDQPEAMNSQEGLCSMVLQWTPHPQFNVSQFVFLLFKVPLQCFQVSNLSDKFPPFKIFCNLVLNSTGPPKKP